MPSTKQVSILMGSDSDLDVMAGAADIMKQFQIPFELTIASAHRSPNWTRRYLQQAERRGIRVFIAGAGGAAHLAGVVAAHTTRPVIGVPIESPALKGLDSLLSTVQMPAGVPVGTMAIGRVGARNAGIFAVQILAASNKSLSNKLKAFKKSLEKKVEEKAKKIQRQNS